MDPDSRVRILPLLGPGESCRTPAERFAELAACGKDAQIKEVVEATAR